MHEVNGHRTPHLRECSLAVCLLFRTEQCATHTHTHTHTHALICALSFSHLRAHSCKRTYTHRNTYQAKALGYLDYYDYKVTQAEGFNKQVCVLASSIGT